MNVVLAVNDKSIEKFLSKHKEINVLTSLKKREQIIDRVLELNPHTVVISKVLSGKLDFKEIIIRLRELKPSLKIVYLYGSTDSEYKLFTDFLIRNKAYNFIVGGIDEENLIDVVLKTYTIDDVKGFMLSDTEKQEEEAKQKEIIEQEQKKQQQIQQEEVEPIEVINHQQQLDVLIVEKIIEREKVQNKFIGTITVGIASLFTRSGCTHFSLCFGSYLKKQKLDFGIVINKSVYDSLMSFYMTDKEPLVIKGVHLYNDYIKAKNSHKIVIYDVGQLCNDNEDMFYEMSQQILLSPSSAWEIDTLTNFLRDSDYAHHISYIFFPISNDYFREIYKNLAKGSFKAYQLKYSNLFEYKENVKLFDKLSESIIKGL